MRILEFWWYELSPYLYGASGVYFTLNIKNGGMYFSFILLLLSIWIVAMRVHHRSGLLPVGADVPRFRAHAPRRRPARRAGHRQRA